MCSPTRVRFKNRRDSRGEVEEVEVSVHRERLSHGRELVHERVCVVRLLLGGEAPLAVHGGGTVREVVHVGQPGTFKTHSLYIRQFQKCKRKNNKNQVTEA